MIRPELGAPPEQRDRASLVEGLRSTLAGIARQQPAALVLDDLCWADHAALELLSTLAGALEHAPLLIVGAWRSDEIPRDSPVRRLRGEPRRSGQHRGIVIPPLDREKTTQLAARVLGAEPSPALAAALQDRKQGVPFFVEELALALVNGGRLHQGADGLSLGATDELPLPESVRDVVGSLVEGLTEPARRVLDIAAVAGEELDLDLVTSFSGADDSGLKTLLDRGLLVESCDGRAAFRHALTREACYLNVPWSRRRALHREIGSRLEATRATTAVVAEHWLAAREPERACRSLIAADSSSGQANTYARVVRESCFRLDAEYSITTVSWFTCLIRSTGTCVCLRDSRPWRTMMPVRAPSASRSTAATTPIRLP